MVRDLTIEVDASNDVKAANRTVAMIDAFLSLFPGAENGPAHVVLSDYNLEDEWIDGRIAEMDRGTPLSQTDAAAVHFLRALRCVPEAERTAGLRGGYTESQ